MRPFFNVPYMFIGIVMDSKLKTNDFSYIRPHGEYWESLVARDDVDTTKLKTHFTINPNVYFRSYERNGKSILPSITLSLSFFFF